jgi:pimeloyl-ACP methyl ester carboxylesterase
MIRADFEFAHPLIHLVVYAELARRRRRGLHAEVGHLLENFSRGRETLYAEQLAYHFLESDDDAKALEYSVMAGDKIMRGYYDADLALNYYLQALEMIAGREPSLRHLRGGLPVPLRRGAVHRFTPEEREGVVVYLSQVLQGVGQASAARAVAQLASRICVTAMHTGEVYEASIRLYEQSSLGPDVQKLTVGTSRGRLIGILEFPGPGGPHSVVLMFHGSPGSKEMTEEWAQPFRARGLATLRVDLPGFGETTVPATDSLVDSVVILKEMVTAVLAHERVDSRGVGVVGWSYGPLIAAHLCAHDDRVRAMVGISGVYNPLHPLERQADEAALDPVFRAWLEARWKAGMRPRPGPLSYGPDASATDVADRIRCPMLIMYGALEPERFRVQAEEFAAAAPTATTQVWRSGVHALLNVPEALESAADWMKDKLSPGTPG